MSKGYRKIIVDGREWKYKIGKSYCVANAIDNNEKKLIHLAKLAGVDQHTFERALYKHTFHITPAMVADWIKHSEGVSYEPPVSNTFNDPYDDLNNSYDDID